MFIIFVVALMMYPCVADEYVITFTGYDDGKIKITYQEDSGVQSFTLPKDSQYNKMITDYIKKFKLFNQ